MTWKPPNCFSLTDILLAISDELKLIVPTFALPLYCLFLLSCFLGVSPFGLFWVLSAQNNTVEIGKSTIMDKNFDTLAKQTLSIGFLQSASFLSIANPLSPFSKLQYAPWTLSPGYNIEKGGGDRNVKIRDRNTHVFNETCLYPTSLAL